jgi:hypothetical protein
MNQRKRQVMLQACMICEFVVELHARAAQDAAVHIRTSADRQHQLRVYVCSSATALATPLLCMYMCKGEVFIPFLQNGGGGKSRIITELQDNQKLTMTEVALAETNAAYDYRIRMLVMIGGVRSRQDDLPQRGEPVWSTALQVAYRFNIALQQQAQFILHTVCILCSCSCQCVTQCITLCTTECCIASATALLVSTEITTCAEVRCTSRCVHVYTQCTPHSASLLSLHLLTTASACAYYESINSNNVQ